MFEDFEFLIKEIRKKLEEYEREKEEVRNWFKRAIKEILNEWAVKTSGILKKEIELFNFGRCVYYIKFGETDIYWKDEENLSSGIADLMTIPLEVSRYIYITLKSKEFTDRVRNTLENLLKDISANLENTRYITFVWKEVYYDQKSGWKV